MIKTSKQKNSLALFYFKKLINKGFVALYKVKISLKLKKGFMKTKTNISF